MPELLTLFAFNVYRLAPFVVIGGVFVSVTILPVLRFIAWLEQNGLIDFSRRRRRRRR